MATASATTTGALHIINAATKSELKLTERAGFFKLGDTVVLGDLYVDPLDAHVAILLVARTVPLKELPAVVGAAIPVTGQAAPSGNGTTQVPAAPPV